MSVAIWQRTQMNTAQNVRPARDALPFVLASLLLAGAHLPARAGETNVPATPPARTEDAANTADTLRSSYLHLQEQLQAAQLALERNRQESETLAARNEIGRASCRERV